MPKRTAPRTGKASKRRRLERLVIRAVDEWCSTCIRRACNDRNPHIICRDDKNGNSQKCITCRDARKGGCDHNTISPTVGAEVAQLGAALRDAEHDVDWNRAWRDSLSDLALTDDESVRDAKAGLSRAKAHYDAAHAAFDQNRVSLPAPAGNAQYGAEEPQPNDGSAVEQDGNVSEQDGGVAEQDGNVAEKDGGVAEHRGILSARLRDCLIIWMSRTVYEFGAEAVSRGWCQDTKMIDMFDEPGGMMEKIHEALTGDATRNDTHGNEGNGGEE
ncbi:hypothetical protein RB594_007318 [Gaeumannomyces avenae]